jgi:hypothetical protein
MKNYGCSVAMLFAVGLVLFLVINEGKPERDYKRAVRETQAMIDRTHLIGASPKEVIAYLDKHDIEHTGFVLKAAPLETDVKPQSIRMLQRDISEGITFSCGPYTEDLLVFLIFDNQNKLHSYSFGRWYHGF